MLMQLMLFLKLSKVNLIPRSKKAEQSNWDIQTAHDTLNKARDKIIQLANQVQSGAHAEIELARQISQLSADATQVKGVLSVIGDIADQTKSFSPQRCH